MWINSFPTLNVQSFPPSFTFLRECTLLPIRESWRSGRIIILTIELHILRDSFLTQVGFLKLSTALLVESNRSCSIGCPPVQELLTDWAASSEQPTNARSTFAQQPYNIALCGYPIVKMEIRDSSQISTIGRIFLLSNYFRLRSFTFEYYLGTSWTQSTAATKFTKSQLQFKQAWCE